MPVDHQQIVQDLLTYLKSNLQESMTVGQLAKKSGYSRSFIKYIFKKYTGRTLLPHLLDMRMDKGKSLLRETKLSISDIAFEAGFNSLNQFSRLFRKKTGCSPGEFRRTEVAPQKTGTAPVNSAGVRRCHPLKGTHWNRQFKRSLGSWKQELEYLSGHSEGEASLVCLEALPENFRLTFETCLLPGPGISHAQLDLSLFDPKTKNSPFLFSLGHYGGQAGSFLLAGCGNRVNPAATLTRDEWHKIQLELEDDSLKVSADGNLLFSHKYPFPPRYTSRSHFKVGTFQSQIHLREVEVADLGFFPLIKSIRLGDSLYNSGMFPSALEYYMRLLESGNSSVDIMEIRYKIGKCFLEENNYSSARVWMDSVIAPGDNFWAGEARLSLFDADVREGLLDRVGERLRVLFARDSLRSGLRDIIAAASGRFFLRGYFEKACFLLEELFRLEEPGSIPAHQAQSSLAEAFMQVRMFPESESHFRAAGLESPLPLSERINLLFTLCDVLGFQGKEAEWKRMLDQVEALTEKDPFSRLRLRIYKTFYLRANGKIEEALAALDCIQPTLPNLNSLVCFTKIQESILCSCLGKSQEGRDCLEEARRVFPAHHYLNPDFRSPWLILPDWVEGKYEIAARFYANSAQTLKGSCSGAECAIISGILFSLAKLDAEAAQIWKTTPDFYIEGQYNFVGTLADHLLRGKTENAENMPYPAERRSEMFYFLGFYCEAKGEKDRSAELFRLCIAEDKLCHWPAIMVARKLAELGSRKKRPAEKGKITEYRR